MFKNKKLFFMLLPLSALAITAPIISTSCSNTDTSIKISPSLNESKYDDNFVEKNKDKMPKLEEVSKLESDQKAKEFIKNTANQTKDVFHAMFELSFWNNWKQETSNKNIVDFKSDTTFNKVEIKTNRAAENDKKIESVNIEIKYRASFTKIENSDNKKIKNTIFIENEIKTTKDNSIDNSSAEDFKFHLEIKMISHKVNNEEKVNPEDTNKQVDISFVSVINEYNNLKNKKE